MNISGLGEVSDLALMWDQGDEQEKLLLAITLLTDLYQQVEQTIELKADTADGLYVITVERK